MPHGTGGGGRTSTPAYKVKGEKLTKALIIEEVKIIEVPKEIIVPNIKYKDKEQIKLITHEESQIKYNTIQKDTTEFIRKEQATTEYIKKEEPTTKYIRKDVEVEFPVLVDTPYERPIIINKECTIASIKDMENVRVLMKLIPEMSKAIDELRKKVESLVEYKLVEEVVKAPKIEWVTTPVERIIWKDVTRERPKI